MKWMGCTVIVGCQFKHLNIKILLFSSPIFQTRSIDASAALAMPGVVTFISAKDVPGQNRRLWFNNLEEVFAEEEVVCLAKLSNLEIHYRVGCSLCII